MKEKLEKRLLRFRRLRDEIIKNHAGKEVSLTYYAGHNLGYVEGEIRILEEWLDSIGADA